MRFLVYAAAIVVASGALLAWPRAFRGGLPSMAMVFAISLVARVAILGGLLMLGASRELRMEAVMVVLGTQLLEALIASKFLWNQPAPSRTVAT